MLKYTLLELENIIVTQGINDLIGKEFSINKGSYSIGDIEKLIDYVLKYLDVENKEIKDLETIAYGSWMIQFVFNGIYIELHELKDIIDGENHYKFDLSFSINCLKQQTQICFSKNVIPDFPKIGQKVAISKEIYEGSEVNGVRYSAPTHMTGWYLTSDSYNGDINSLLIEHLYHILKERPDLVKFFALPIGYRFKKDANNIDIWFDEEVAKS